MQSSFVKVYVFFVVFLGAASLTCEETAATDALEIYWKSRISDSKLPKDKVLFEMLRAAVQEQDGSVRSLMRTKGPELFCKEEGVDIKSFQKHLLAFLALGNLETIQKKYQAEIKNPEVELLKMARLLFFLYPSDRLFSAELKSLLEKAQGWTWADKKSLENLRQFIDLLEKQLGPDIAYHLHQRIYYVRTAKKNYMLLQWELIEMVRSYSAEAKAFILRKTYRQKTPLQFVEGTKFPDKGLWEDYGTQEPLSFSSVDDAIIFFNRVTKEWWKNKDLENLKKNNWGKIEGRPLAPFVQIPKGLFNMGSERSNTSDIMGETLHKVELKNDYEMQATEVTQFQWYLVMHYNNAKFKEITHCPKGSTSSFIEIQGTKLCPDHPVENVSWVETKEFFKILNEQQDGYTYRLPTEAEWERAVRADTTAVGTTANYSIDESKESLPEVAWFEDTSKGETHAVGLLKPNGFGLYDMHGNVWEWTLDWSGPYVSASQTDPKGPGMGVSKIIRGGSYFGPAKQCGSAYRYDWSPTDQYHFLGFRSVRTKS